MDILDFVLLQDYRLQIGQTTPGIILGGVGRSSADESADRADITHDDCSVVVVPYYSLPHYLGYDTAHEVYLEYEELIPGDPHTLVYSVHDMNARSSDTYHVKGTLDTSTEIFIVTSVEKLASVE